MPKEGTKPSKYDDEIITEELGPNYEQKQWEEDKLGQAKMKFGAKDAKSKNKVFKLMVCLMFYLSNRESQMFDRIKPTDFGKMCLLTDF